MKTPIRRFIFTLLFLGLVGLAFNPHFVVKLQENLGLSDDRILAETPRPTNEEGTPPKNKPQLLPITKIPNEDGLPRINGFEKIAKDDRWIGTTPCGTEIFDAPLTLPNLGPRTSGEKLAEPITASYGQKISDQPTFKYISQNGVTLRLVEPVVKFYTVLGKDFRAAQKDIFESKPLRRPENTEPQNEEIKDGPATTTLANISSPTSLYYYTYGSGSQYRILPEKTVLTSAFLITLPKWESYETATAADQAKWDDLLCNASHHELGHLRIRLDILAETLDGYAALPKGRPKAEIERQIKAYRQDINARIQKRQDAYHIYNDGGLRRGMTELPYAELPFPWLKNQSD